MAISGKTKLLYITRILSEETDENHGLTRDEIIDILNNYGIDENRKTFYSDIEELQNYGYDIIQEQIGKKYIYKLVSRDFELAELKLLVDSVQAAKFISEKKSHELIKKLGSLASRHETKELNRQVHIHGRVKTSENNVLYNVDNIHLAIAENKKITFTYYQWNIKKQLVPRHNGKKYQVSPWALIWDDEYYYLVAYDRDYNQLRHYRVDKMKGIEITKYAREGSECFEKLELPEYSKSLFGMFSGNQSHVDLLCHNDIVGIILDRFGKNISITPVDENHFSTWVDVALSDKFYTWVASIGDKVKITGPTEAVENMKDLAKRLSKQYLE